LIAIFVGIGLVYKEIEKRTIYTIIAKPIHRYQFLLGKYLGLILTLLFEVAIMTTGFLFILYFYESTFDLNLLNAILLIFLELMLITSIALLFSTFSTPILSGIFTLAVFVIGHLTLDLKTFGANSKNILVRYLTEFMYYLLPNLENFNIKGEVVHHIPVSWEYMGYVLIYGIFYITITLFVSAIIFQRRDFK
jgi:ABC-type transport system involved in multi-copper enzyme maturation permease subunit